MRPSICLALSLIAAGCVKAPTAGETVHDASMMTVSDSGLPAVDAGEVILDAGEANIDAGLPGVDAGPPAPDAGPPDAGMSIPDSGVLLDAGFDAGVIACGCNGKADCAVWSHVYVSWYGFNDNSCSTESQHGCNDIAFAAPVSAGGEHGTPYPNAGNIKHTEATEGTGTYDDPITAASSADSDPHRPTSSNPRHAFESSGGVTLTPGTIIYNPEVKKYFIMEDSCIECGDEYACIVSPEDTDDGTVPAGCVPGTNLHIDFWMGPQFNSDKRDLNACENKSTVGNDWAGGPGQVIVNPPDNLPVVTTPLYSGTDGGGTCWTSMQQAGATCP